MNRPADPSPLLPLQRSRGIQKPNVDPPRDDRTVCAPARYSAADARMADHRADADERDLLQRVGCGDRRAFQQLYFNYRGRLARFLLRVTRTRADLEEIINDTLLIVWRRSGDFRGASRVSTWIFGIAYRCALRSIRRAAMWSRASALPVHEGEPLVDDVAVCTADRQLVEFALSKLPAEQRLALILAYRMGYSCEEIAVTARCPVNTIKTRMFHARHKLRTIIDTAVAPTDMKTCDP
jgi:RNA polymerase sigma-70 factor, ECF subfamily